MSGAILNLIKKKEYIRQKLKLSPSSYVREKLKNLRKTVKRMLWNSRDEFLGSFKSDLNIASHADVLRGSSRVPAGMRDEPLRTSAWEANLNTNPKRFFVDMEAEFQIAYNS